MTGRTPDAAFYCVADERYFLGAVALINSLRLLGHDEPIRMLDCGLTVAQRELVEPHAEIVEERGGTPPWLLKTVVPLARPASVMALLDVDMIAVASLRPLLVRAQEGRLLAFVNPVQRRFEQWGELLGLGPVRDRRYLSSAAIFAARDVGQDVLSLMADRQSRIDFERTHWRANEDGYPFLYADQDVFNAILATRVEPERVVDLDERLAPTPPFDGLRLIDVGALRCEDQTGESPLLVHHHVTKPWLEPTHHGVYSQLLSRLLTGEDLAVRPPPATIPLRLRTGGRAWLARKRVNARERLRWHVLDPLRNRAGAR